MILRDIFLTLENLLDLHYEKNANGTYRVNTVIKELVYPSLYLNQTFQDNEIEFYLANIEYSYQGEANIRNAFTELMRPRENSNRYPTLCFCDSIDINQMYNYYQQLIQKASLNDSEKASKINNFIESSLASEEELRTKLQLICHQPYQYITWIVIFSMFNAQLAYDKYEAYLKINASEYSSFHLTNTATRHTISRYLQKKRRHLTCVTVLLIIANSLQLAYFVLPFILPDNIMKSPLSSVSSCIVLLILSTLLLGARFGHMNIAKKYSLLQTYYDNFDLNEDISELLKNTKNYETLQINPYKITTHAHIERENFRLKIRTATAVGLALCLILSILTKSFPFMLAGTCLTCLLSIFVDRRFNEIHYSCHYDSLTLKESEKPDPLRGMAKIYRREYEITGFDPNHEYYYTTAHVHSSACFRHIFSMTYNRIYNFIIVTTIVLMCFNVFIFCIAILYQLVPEMYTYLRVPSDTFFAPFIVLFLIILSIINIISLLGTNSNYMSLAQLAFVSSFTDQDISYTERTFLHLQSQGKIKEVDVARGIFSHSMEYIDKGLQLETIWPESDRMLFIHRIPTLRPWLIPMTWLLFGIFFCILVWHCKLYILALPILGITILSNIIIEVFILANWKKKTFIRAIRNLD